MALVGRRRTRDSLDSKPRRRLSSTLSQLFSKTRRVSVEPPPSIASNDTPFHHWLAQYTTDPVTKSPTSSFDIRRPSGLGPRCNSFGSVSSLGSIHRAVVVDIGYSKPGHHRRSSASEPDLLRFSVGQSDAQPVNLSRSLASPMFESRTPSMCETRSDSVSLPYTPSYTNTNNLPARAWENVAQFLPRRDLSSLACVSTYILSHVRKAMYEDIDLQSLLPDAGYLCIRSLASHPELALLVRTFKSSILPSFNDQHGPLPSLSLAFALCNMKNLVSLSLPRFDNTIFHYATFRLKHLSLSCETMSVLEQEQFSSWLSTQRDMSFLSLPALTTEPTCLPCIPVQRPSEPNCVGIGRSSFRTPPSRLLSVPNLQKFDGPISLAQRLIPGRPVSEVVIHVNKTLYDGLKPSQLMDSIAKSTALIERLSIRSSPSVVVDARTMERLLMSAGAKFGSSVLYLEIGWASDDETLYQHMPSIISRFSNLQALNYVLTPVPFKMVSSSATNHGLSTSLAAPAPSLLSSPRKSSVEIIPTPQLLSLQLPTTADCASDVARGRERQFVKSWVKLCPSLTSVTFLCGAEWYVIKRKRRFSAKSSLPKGLADEPLMCVPSFVRWRRA